MTMMEIKIEKMNEQKKHEMLLDMNDRLKTHNYSDAQRGVEIADYMLQQLKEENVPVEHTGLYPLVQDTSGTAKCVVTTDADDYYTMQFYDIALTTIPTLMLSRLVHKFRLSIRNVLVHLKARNGDYSNPFQKAFVVQLQIFYDFVEHARRQLQLELYQYQEFRKTVADEKLEQLARVIQEGQMDSIEACPFPASFFASNSADRRRIAEIARVVENMSECVDEIQLRLDYDMKLKLYVLKFEGVKEISYPFLEFFTHRFASRISKLVMRQVDGDDCLSLDVYAEVERDTTAELFTFTNRYIVADVPTTTTGKKRQRDVEPTTTPAQKRGFWQKVTSLF